MSDARFDIEDRIVAALKKRDGVATAGDVAADTGLGVGDVEAALRRMLSLYKSHLDVDDDGNLRYRFDPSFTRRGEDRARLLYDLGHAVWTGFKWLFKVWIMVMLVGYTITFILLLLALAVAAIAASVASDNDADGLIELPIYLLARTLETLFWISWFDDYGSGRRHNRRSFRGETKRREVKRPEKAFYHKVFDYVFGPEKKTDPLKAHAAFTAFVREHNGRVTAADWAARSGQSLTDADSALTAAIVRFHGDVDVAHDGTLIYRFDELMVTAGRERFMQRGPANVWANRAKLPSFTGNPTGTNWWISILNVFNLIMAFGVLNYSFEATALGHVVHPGIHYGLGIVPLAFSMVFFAIPAIRYIGHLTATAKAERETRRRQEVGRIYRSVQGVRAEPIELDAALAKELAADFEGEPLVDGSGRTFFTFDEIKQQLEAGARAREAAAGRVVFGQTVFSSDEDEKSLAQADLDDFDARLARELEGSHIELDFHVAAPVAVN